MNRRVLSVVKLLALAGLVVSVLSSCFLLDLFGDDPITVAQRIQGFEDELNKADRSDMYLQFDDFATTDYDAIKASAFWETDFPVGTGYTTVITDDTNTDDVRVTIDGPVEFGGPKYYSFDMSQDIDDNNMIEGLYVTSDEGVTWVTIVE